MASTFFHVVISYHE